MKRNIRIASALVVSALVVGACGGDDDSTADTEASPTTPAPATSEAEVTTPGTAAPDATTSDTAAPDNTTSDTAAPECNSTVSGDLDECEYGAEFAAEWTALIDAARAEGTIAIVSGPSVDNDAPWFEAFADYFGLEVDNFGGATGDVTARVAADRELGDYVFDIANQGGTGTRNFLEAGWIAEAAPLMIHPDFFNMTEWAVDYVPWVDETQKYCYYYTIQAEPQIAALWYNTETVTEEDLATFTSWRNMLDPRWKGRIVIGDIGGGEAGSDRATLWAVLGEEWFDTLLREQDPIIVPYGSAREHADILARGDADWGFFSSGDDSLQDAQDAGLPVSFYEETLSEGAPRELIQRACVMKDAPHANAAKLFMNWIWTYEGGRVYNEANLRPGRAHVRDDVPQGTRDDEIWARRFDDSVPFLDDLNPVMIQAQKESLEWVQAIYDELNISPGG